MTNEVVSSVSEILLKRQYERGFEPPPENILFRIQNEPIGSLQSFIVISGLPKTAKSTWLTAILSSSITGEQIFSMHLTVIKERPIIAYFDTESSIVDFYKHMERVKSFSGVTELPENIKPYCTRQDSPTMQKKLIEEHFKMFPETSVLFVDGLLDLCLNYNDETESRKLINWLKKISVEKNILIFCVLHTGKDGSQRLGHLGANTDRWAQSTLQSKKEEDKFILEPKFLRSSGGFTPIELIFDKDSSKYVLFNEGHLQGKNHWRYLNQSQHFQRLDIIFKDQSSFSYDEFIKKIKEIEKKGNNYCKEYFTHMKSSEWIRQNFDQKWCDSRKLF